MAAYLDQMVSNLSHALDIKPILVEYTEHSAVFGYLFFQRHQLGIGSRPGRLVSADAVGEALSPENQIIAISD